jgi:DNA-3-methyladenine glycosylase II
MSLSYDVEKAMEVLRKSDVEMARLLDRVGPCWLEIRSIHNTFQALMRAIVYQQLSGKAAGTIYGRVCDLFEAEGPPHPEDILAVDEESLRGAGLSRAKTAAVKDLADKTINGVVPEIEHLHTMDDEDILQRLTSVRGIGPWTVEMLLIFNLGRPDVWPVSDLGVRKGFMLAYGLNDLPKPRELASFGERWRPYRSVASWYFWRATDDLEW